jgi:hypothetical protein
MGDEEDDGSAGIAAAAFISQNGRGEGSPCRPVLFTGQPCRSECLQYQRVRKFNYYADLISN